VSASQKTKNGRLASLASNPLDTVPILKLWAKNGLSKQFVLSVNKILEGRVGQSQSNSGGW